MTLEELKKKLDRYEWNDVQFKAARLDVPRDACKTVSAFAITLNVRKPLCQKLESPTGLISEVVTSAPFWSPDYCYKPTRKVQPTQIKLT